MMGALRSRAASRAATTVDEEVTFWMGVEKVRKIGRVSQAEIGDVRWPAEGEAMEGGG